MSQNMPNAESAIYQTDRLIDLAIEWSHFIENLQTSSL